MEEIHIDISMEILFTLDDLQKKKWNKDELKSFNFNVMIMIIYINNK